jgi:hypothetical protein
LASKPGVTSTSCTARVSRFGRKEVEARVFTWWHIGVYAPLDPPLIFIDTT